jgi:hypothetical protein
MRVLYLVCGETNGWEWPVAAYHDKKRAEKHRARAQSAVRRLWDDYREMPQVVKAMVRNPYDQVHCCAGMYAVEYRVEVVPWCDEESYESTRTTASPASSEGRKA